VSPLPSHDGQFTVTVDHWRGRGWTLVRNVDLSYEEAEELVVVYRALGYADERIHIAPSGVATSAAAA
jgi:hypothetical protein